MTNLHEVLQWRENGEVADGKSALEMRDPHSSQQHIFSKVYLFP